jgi:hypothetical protein
LANEHDAPLCGVVSSDIRVYTYWMRILKVRRVGNSNVVSIPREYEAKGYAPGSSVLLDELPDGELRLLPTERVREQIRGVGRRVVEEHREALQILAEHDPDAKKPTR